MPTTRDQTARARARARARLGVGIVIAVEAVALGLVALAQDPATRPVTTALGDSALGNATRQTVSEVDERAAVVVVIALLAVGRFVAPRLRPWIDPLLTTPITLFVVAELNGVQDLAALVGIYALASAGVLLSIVQSRVRVIGGHPRLPLGFAAAVGIVPWGIVAFHQLGARVVGSPLAGILVLVTLAALAFALAEFVATWRGREAAATAARIVGMSLVAWLVVVGV